MNKFTNLLVMVCLITIPLISSAQNHKRAAKQWFDQGHFLHAASHYVAQLSGERRPEKKFPWKCEMLEALVQAEPFALDRIAKLEELTREFEGDHSVREAESIVNTYDSLAQLEKRFEELPGKAMETRKCNQLSFSTGDYSEASEAAKLKLDSLREQAAAFHYQNAVREMEADQLPNYRNAYFEFQAVRRFADNYKDVETLQQTAYEKGQRRVMVLPFAYRGQGGFQPQVDQLHILVTGTVNQDKTAAFWTTFVPYTEKPASQITEADAHAMARKHNLHDLYMGQITGISFPQPVLTKEEGSETNRVIVSTRRVADPDKPGKFKTENIYGDETFTYQEYTKSVSATLTGSFRYYDADAQTWGNTQALSGTYGSSYTWVEKSSGSDKAWKASKLNKTRPVSSTFSSPIQRVPYLIDQASSKIATMIIRQENRQNIIVKTEKK